MAHGGFTLSAADVARLGRADGPKIWMAPNGEMSVTYPQRIAMDAKPAPARRGAHDRWLRAHLPSAEFARVALDALREDMPPRGGANTHGLIGDQVDAAGVTEWLKQHLSPEDYAELQNMLFGGEDNGGEDQGGPGLAKPDDLERRRPGPTDRALAQDSGMSQFVRDACARLRDANRP